MNVLFLCSANRDRSPTAEQVFRDVPGWYVRSAGTESYAETQVTKEMLDWADRIFVMEERHLKSVVAICPSCLAKITILGIEDEYSRNSARLVGKLILKMANIVALDEWIAQRFDLDSHAGEVGMAKCKKTEFYTEENPSGPWSRALRGIREKAASDRLIPTSARARSWWMGWLV